MMRDVVRSQGLEEFQRLSAATQHHLSILAVQTVPDRVGKIKGRQETFSYHDTTLPVRAHQKSICRHRDPSQKNSAGDISSLLQTAVKHRLQSIVTLGSASPTQQA